MVLPSQIEVYVKNITMSSIGIRESGPKFYQCIKLVPKLAPNLNPSYDTYLVPRLVPSMALKLVPNLRPFFDTYLVSKIIA